jgi:DNA-3-methyladenine glycosylase II
VSGRERTILRLTRESLAEGTAALKRMDPSLGRWMERVGPVTLRRQRYQFGMLCRSIISQQLAAGAARSIHERFIGLFAQAKKPDPESLLRLRVRDLRACGLSGRKVDFMKGLAREFQDGLLRRVRLSALVDEEVIELLTRLPGIGRWTAEMFLIFSLGRQDVFSVGDLALRNAVERVREKTLDPKAIERVASAWSPYRSVASLHLWKIAHWESRE